MDDMNAFEHLVADEVQAGLGRVGERVWGFAADDVILTGGAQQALALAVSIVTGPEDVVLCEAATFIGFKALASTALRLPDADGVGLAAALCRRSRVRARAGDHGRARIEV